MLPIPVGAQQAGPPDRDLRIYEIIEAASPEPVEADIRTLAGFGTRNTMSDTLSDERGIGAARRWIKAEFDRISEECGGCRDVYYLGRVVEGGRIPEPTNIVNVIAVLRGTTHPDRYVIMSGDIDSRASDGEVDVPGANGMAGTVEAARISQPAWALLLERGLRRARARSRGCTGALTWQRWRAQRVGTSPRSSTTT